MIVISVIPHSQQRYSTCGDWQMDAQGNVHIKVSDTGNSFYNFLIAFHEQIEAELCANDGITAEMVDEFDFAFKGDDPGADPNAPYHKQHMIAESLEHQLAVHLGVDWDAYEQAINRLFEEAPNVNEANTGGQGLRSLSQSS